MATDTTTAGTEGQAPGTGTAPATGTGTAQAPVTPTAQGQASGSTAATDAAANDQLAKAQARIRELEDLALTEAQRRDRRLAELEAERTNWELERQSMTLRQAVLAEAVKAGAVYPDLVANTVSPAGIRWSKDGKPENVAQAVAEARTSYPALFRVAPGSADGGAGQGVAGAAPSMNDLIRQKAGRA